MQSTLEEASLNSVVRGTIRFKTAECPFFAPILAWKVHFVPRLLGSQNASKFQLTGALLRPRAIQNPISVARDM